MLDISEKPHTLTILLMHGAEVRGWRIFQERSANSPFTVREGRERYPSFWLTFN